MESRTQEDTSKTIEKTVESMFFNELNEDAFMPMNILAMVQLSDCSLICGGLNSEDIKLGAKLEFGTTSQQQKQQKARDPNKDTCIAVAGLPANNTVAVKKYCIPKAQGQGVRGAPTETWFVWYSEEWSFTIISLHFGDSVSGDTLVVLRDNHGQSLESGHVMEDIVSVHSRNSQSDPELYDKFYHNKKLRLSRFAFTNTRKMDVVGFSKKSDVPLKITEIYVIPGDEAMRGSSNTWMLMSYTVARHGEGSITTSLKRDVCVVLDINDFINNLGSTQMHAPEECNLQGFFESMRGSALVPVLLPSLSEYDLQILVMPTSSQALVDACIVQLNLVPPSTVSTEQNKICFNTPSEFVTGANFPTRAGWMDLQRSMFLGVTEIKAAGRGPATLTQEGTVVNGPTRRVLSQNSLDPIDLASITTQKVGFYGTSDSAGGSSHWLRQIRIAMHPDDDGNLKSVSASSMHSEEVRLTVTSYHTCSRMSCLGCGTAKLQALCYAAQQCSIVRCVGTIVNQNRPLCNIGLVLASHAETSLLMMMGAWTIFTETYTKILDAALIGPSNSMTVEWVDDAFFGYVCSAKDALGQMTSVITSSVGAGIITGYNTKRRLAANIDQGGSALMGHDNAFTASVTMLLNGVNAFLYQLVLLPLYSMIALQKSIVCTANDVFALFDVTDFKIRLGRPDLQRASDVAAGVCMTKFFDGMMEESGIQEVTDDFISGLNQFMQNSGQLRGAIKAGSASSLGKRSSKILTLATSKLDSAASSISLNKGSKKKPLFEKFKNAEMVRKLGNVMGKIQLTAPIHALDSMITYLIGVVGGLEDMAQVLNPKKPLPSFPSLSIPHK